MNLKFISLLALLLLVLDAPYLFSQKEDYHWVLGYRLDIPTMDTSYGRCELIFTDTSVSIKKTFNVLNPLNYTNASIADSNGNLLFYTNGLEVYDRNYEVMPNGDDLNPGEFAETAEGSGYVAPSGALALALPLSKNKYLLIHHTYERDTRYWDWHAGNMLTTLVDMNLRNGLGDVVYKNVSVYKDSLSYGGLTACRHANGRDWWILCPYFTGKKMFTFLLDPGGLHYYNTQNIPFEFYPGTGQADFSPDGTKYSFIHYNDFYVREFFLCDFDRCSGLVNNFHYGQIPKFDLCGVAFSPNSRFLYLSTGPLLYQLDMNDPTPFDSKIQVDSVDGFKSLGNFRSWFQFMQLAPNGKIYVSNGRGPKHLSTIEQPNLKGKACDVRQHNILIVANSSMTNFPDFRLGPFEGSECDTLNKLPNIDWSFKQDSFDRHRIRFLDESKYEITSRQWDFGDQMSFADTSNVISPIYTYSGDGTYNVCLNVKNSRGSDTLCRQIFIRTTATNYSVKDYNRIDVFPNPFTDIINFQIHSSDYQDISYKLFNSLNQTLQVGQIQKPELNLDLNFLKSGIYYLCIYQDGVSILVHKLIKL